MQGTPAKRHRFALFTNDGDDWVNYRITTSSVITGNVHDVLELAELGDALDSLQRILDDAPRRAALLGSLKITIEMRGATPSTWEPLPTAGNGMPDQTTWTFPL